LANRGAEDIDGIDCPVRRSARQQGFQSGTLDEIVTRVDERLRKNRAAGPAMAQDRFRSRDRAAGQS
jgi:hypothetical protein